MAITILKVVDGKYVNLPKGHRGYDTMLTSVDAKGFMGNTHTKETSHEAKEKAIKEAKRLEKEGWKLVCILPHHTYGYPWPYRYEILSFGGYKGK